MSGENWTPGPWETKGYVNNENEAGWFIFLPTEKKRTITVEGSNEKEATANANLIAAAPELYEALKVFSDLNMGDRESLDNARKALAKARGEQ